MLWLAVDDGALLFTLKREKKREIKLITKWIEHETTSKGRRRSNDAELPTVSHNSAYKQDDKGRLEIIKQTQIHTSHAFDTWMRPKNRSLRSIAHWGGTKEAERGGGRVIIWGLLDGQDHRFLYLTHCPFVRTPCAEGSARFDYSVRDRPRRRTKRQGKWLSAEFIYSVISFKEEDEVTLVRRIS